MQWRKRISYRGAALVCAGLLAAGCADNPAGSDGSAAPVVPETPSVADLPSRMVGGAREFRLTAQVFTQQLETFPYRTAQVWGYNGSTPGPTAISYEGEKVRFIVKNELSVPTTIHFHGAHAPNDNDGVAGVSQPVPIPPGQTYTYEFTPGHAGTFAYHSHTDGSTQEMKGLDGIFIVLPRSESRSERVARDFAFTMQTFFIPGEGQPVNPMPPGGEFNTFTMNGKTRDAVSEIPIKVGEKIRVRLYNASNMVHSMHMHGADMTIVSQNGHIVPPEARHVVTTVDLGPGNFYEVEFTVDKPGKWLFHCHFPMHTSNDGESGEMGSPVGMARVFNATQ